MNKPRLVQMNKEEVAELRHNTGELNWPYLHCIGDALYCDADELRAWRSTNTSKGDPNVS